MDSTKEARTSNKDKVNWDKIKKPMCTTIRVRERAMFYILCYKKFGYGKYSIQKGITEAIINWNNKEKQRFPKGSKEYSALINEVRDMLVTDVKTDKITKEELEKNRF